MAMPRKGSRRIQVGGVVYSWRFLGGMQGGLKFIVYKGRGNTQPMISIADYSDLVGPGLVRLAILKALKEGWNPDSNDKSVFYLEDCPKDPHRIQFSSVEKHWTEKEWALFDAECIRSRNEPTVSSLKSGVSTMAYAEVVSCNLEDIYRKREIEIAEQIAKERKLKEQKIRDLANKPFSKRHIKCVVFEIFTPPQISHATWSDFLKTVGLKLEYQKQHFYYVLKGPGYMILLSGNPDQHINLETFSKLNRRGEVKWENLLKALRQFYKMLKANYSEYFFQL